jgi:hypothetical protein
MEQEIGLIIDCRAEASDDDLWGELGVDYLHLPTDDTEGWGIPVGHFDRAVEACREHDGKVLVHCHMGVNRAPSTVLAILLDEGMGAIDAYDLIREKRPIAAIAYATDALYAHGRREGWDAGQVNVEVTKLKRHIRSVFGPEEERVIRHAIRDGHRSDKEQRKFGRL